jgi:peroxiredoxin
MSATVNCPECNAPLEVPDKLPAGKRLGCPDCGKTFLPNGSAVRPRQAPRRPRYDDDYDDRPVPRERGSGATVAILIGILVVMLLVGGIATAFVLSLTRETDEVFAATAAPAPAFPPPQGPGNFQPGGPMQGGNLPPAPGVGQPAPEIEGTDLDGKPMKLSDFKGKVVYLDFWGEWCPWCQRMYDYQNRLVARMRDRDFVLLGVNSDGNLQMAQTAVKSHKLAWRSWFDGQNGGIASRYGITAFPTTYLIGKDGLVKKKHEGFAQAAEMDKEVDEVMGDAKSGGPAPAPLGDEATAGAYRVRPPKGYVAENVGAQKGQETYRWKSPDGGSVFEVTLAPAPAEKKLEALLEQDLGTLPGSRGLGWGCSPAERVAVSGITFVRTRWSLQEQPQKWKAAGVVYLGLDGDRLIRLSFREPSLNAASPGDEAAKSFHRAPK